MKVDLEVLRSIQGVTIVKRNASLDVQKAFPDGRRLTLYVVDDKVTGKMLVTNPAWDMEQIQLQKQIGAEVRMRYGKCNGMNVGITYFGRCEINRHYSLEREDLTKRQISTMMPDDWGDEVRGDPIFPKMSAEDMLHMVLQGDDLNNSQTRQKLEFDVLDALAEYEEQKDDEDFQAAYDDSERILECERGAIREIPQPPVPCIHCVRAPCVWQQERVTIITQVGAAHPDTGVTNKQRRWTAYQAMSRIVYGVGTKGLRVRHFTCVEDGVRATYPDPVYAGFSET
jgi:hypothetical protein